MKIFRSTLGSLAWMLVVLALMVYFTRFYKHSPQAYRDSGDVMASDWSGDQRAGLWPRVPQPLDDLELQEMTFDPSRTNKGKTPLTYIRHPTPFDLHPRPVANLTVLQMRRSESLAHRPPQCLLLGFAKCGTSALLQFLNLHPSLVTLDWETDYFCDRVYRKYDIRWYVSRMPVSTPEQITLEKSPCYIVEHEAHHRMHVMNSSLKVMVVVRDPVTRMLSMQGHYKTTENYWGRSTPTLAERSYNAQTRSFRPEVVLKVADYSPHLQHLFDVFPRHQVHIVDGDNFVKDPLSELRLIEEFLGVAHAITERDIFFDKAKGFYCLNDRQRGTSHCLGSHKGRQHEELDPEFRKNLTKYLRPYSERFFEVVGQRFDWDL